MLGKFWKDLIKRRISNDRKLSSMRDKDSIVERKCEEGGERQKVKEKAY